MEVSRPRCATCAGVADYLVYAIAQPLCDACNQVRLGHPGSSGVASEQDDDFSVDLCNLDDSDSVASGPSPRSQWTDEGVEAMVALIHRETKEEGGKKKADGVLVDLTDNSEETKARAIAEKAESKQQRADQKAEKKRRAAQKVINSDQEGKKRKRTKKEPHDALKRPKAQRGPAVRKPGNEWIDRTWRHLYGQGKWPLYAKYRARYQVGAADSSKEGIEMVCNAIKGIEAFVERVRELIGPTILFHRSQSTCNKTRLRIFNTRMRLFWALYQRIQDDLILDSYVSILDLFPEYPPQNIDADGNFIEINLDELAALAGCDTTAQGEAGFLGGDDSVSSIGDDSVSSISDEGFLFQKGDYSQGGGTGGDSVAAGEDSERDAPSGTDVWMPFLGDSSGEEQLDDRDLVGLLPSGTTSFDLFQDSQPKSSDITDPFVFSSQPGPLAETGATAAHSPPVLYYIKNPAAVVLDTRAKFHALRELFLVSMRADARALAFDVTFAATARTRSHRPVASGRTLDVTSQIDVVAHTGVATDAGMSLDTLLYSTEFYIEGLTDEIYMFISSDTAISISLYDLIMQMGESPLSRRTLTGTRTAGAS